MGPSAPTRRGNRGTARNGQELRAYARERLIESRLTPNAISMVGLLGNLVAALLVTQRLFFCAGIAFILGSVMDTLDGRYSRMSGKGSLFGAFLDSTLDRVEEGIVLAAVAGYFAAEGRDFAAAMCVVAVLGSLMVSYTRARAEALGVECKVGVATRPARAGILSSGLIFAKGAGLGDFELLAPAVYVVAALTIFTTFQRVWHVRNQLSSESSAVSGVEDDGGGAGDVEPAKPPGVFSPPAQSRRTSNSMSESNGANGHTNGVGREDEKVRVAIVGVGNCANSFIQGVQYYKDADPADEVPGLMHVELGGYHVRDLEFVAAFDIDQEKVGKDLSEAIWSGQNDTIKFADVPNLGIEVHRGMTHDGLGKYLKEKITKAPGETADVVGILKETKADVLVCYLPVGSEEATKWYVEQALAAGVGFVNCLPVFIAREDYWDKRSHEAGLPIIGDDIKSQVGAPIPPRPLPRLFHDRGVRLERTSQLNVGGNMDFYNMLERERLDSKKESKTNAVTSIMGHELPADDVHVGPSDYVPWLTDRKWAHIRLEGQSFGDVPLNLELKLEVWDSPNSAGIVIDAVRCCKLALNHGIGGQLDGPSAYLMKSPRNQRPDEQARVDTEKFIARYGGRGAGSPRKRPRAARPAPEPAPEG